MAQNYFSIVTNKGRNKLALSAAGGAAVTITHFAIGDGNGAEVNPTAASTALVKEVWRTPVESVVIDPLNPSAVLVTSIIPTNAGGWWMREFGIFDVDGDMVAVAKPVSQYKPTALEGQLEDIRYEFQIIIGETANVTMLVDPSVLLASRAWVESRKVPVAQLSLMPWLPVKSMTVTAPPASPAAWDTYLIPAGATGAWAGHAQKLAEWNGQVWNIGTPPDGHGVSLPDGRVFEKIGGTYVEKIAIDVQSGKWNYAIASGTANALTAALNPTVLSLVEGLTIRLKIPFRNTGAVTLAVNDLGAKALVRPSGSALIADDLVAGSVVQVIYDGAQFVLVGMPKATTVFNFFTSVGSGKITVPVGCTGAEVELWGGGGGGGWGSAGRSGDGGGGGAYAYKRLFGLSAGEELNYVIGAGGDRGFSTIQNGTAGGTTTFNGIFSAGGGAGGRGGANSSYATNGGSPTGADVGLTGCAGGPGINLSGFYGAGPGGSSPKGGLGGPGNSGGGPINGTGPGGGGSGGSNSNAGGFGAAGSIFIRWF